MSDGDRDQGPEAKAATQDVYARAASAAASRSGGSGRTAGSSSTKAGPNGRSADFGSGSSTVPAKTAPPAPKAAETQAAEAAPTPDRPAVTQGWKAKLSSISQRVMGTDETKTEGDAATARSSTAPTQRPAKADRPAAKPTAVVAAPVAPAARTGTRAAPPAVAAPVTGPSGSAEKSETTKPKAGTARRTRKARLRLARLDPWSVMKTAFMFSVAGGIMLVVAVYAIWAVVSGSGLFDNVNEIIASVVSTPGDTTPFRVEDYVNTPKVMGVTAFLACIDVVIITALATLGAFLYNLAATVLGGLEVTLAED